MTRDPGLGKAELREHLDAFRRDFKRVRKNLSKLGLLLSDLHEHKQRLLESHRKKEGVSLESIQKVEDFISEVKKLLSADEE